MKRKIEYLIKNNRFFQLCYRFFGSLFFRFIGLFIHQNKKLILFSSMSGDLYGDSPRVLYEKIRGIYGNSFSYIWAFRDPTRIPEYHGKAVKIDTMSYFISALKAGIWITNVNIERGLSFMKKGTYYVDTWHGSGPKGVEKKRKDYNLSKVSIFTLDGHFWENFFVDNYHVSRDKILYCGRPREDELFHYGPDTKHQARLALGLKDDAKVILFMPTFREATSYSNFGELSMLFDADRLCKNLGGNALVLYHGHHFVHKLDGFAFGNFLIDTTNVSNVNLLYEAADLLITDYSSCMFDFLLLHKPLVCYAPDYDSFVKERPMLFDIDKEIPGGVMKDENALAKRCYDLLLNPELCQFDALLHKFITRGPNATEVVIKKMVSDGALPKQN